MKIKFDEYNVYIPARKGVTTFLVRINEYLELAKGIALVVSKTTDEKHVLIKAGKPVSAEKREAIENFMLTSPVDTHCSVSFNHFNTVAEKLTGFTTEEQFARYLVPVTTTNTSVKQKAGESAIMTTKVNLVELVDTETGLHYNRAAELEAKRLSEKAAKDRKKARLEEMRLEQARIAAEVEAENKRIKQEQRARKAAARKKENKKHKEQVEQEKEVTSVLAAASLFDSLVNLD